MYAVWFETAVSVRDNGWFVLVLGLFYSAMFSCELVIVRRMQSMSVGVARLLTCIARLAGLVREEDVPRLGSNLSGAQPCALCLQEVHEKGCSIVPMAFTRRSDANDPSFSGHNGWQQLTHIKDLIAILERQPKTPR